MQLLTKLFPFLWKIDLLMKKPFANTTWTHKAFIYLFLVVSGVQNNILMFLWSWGQDAVWNNRIFHTLRIPLTVKGNDNLLTYVKFTGSYSFSKGKHAYAVQHTLNYR